MANKSEVKERSIFNKLCSILIDILVIPVIIVAFVCAIFMTSAKANNKVPSILGNSIVEVLTNSMDVGTKESYKVGDVLIIDQNINLDELKVGDCIAFYAPKQSKFTTDGTVNGDSLVIFHRIVRIVYAKEIKNGVPSEEVKRHFVCHGDNAGSLTYIPTQAKIDGSLEPGGDYDQNGNLLPGGGYVVKLLDDSTIAGDSYSAQMEQSTLQYVTDEYVVGVLKNRAGGFLSALVKFCCSETGIILLVIIPASIMICLILFSLVQEAKLAKQERESDQLILAKNISIVGGIGELEESKQIDKTLTDKTEQPPKDVKDANMDEQMSENNTTLGNNVAVKKEPPKAQPNTKAIAPKKPESDGKTVEAKQPPKKETNKPEKVAKAPKTPAKAPVKPEAPKVPKNDMAKPEEPKDVTKKPKHEPKPATPKQAPAKSVASKAPAKPDVPKSPVKTETTKVPPKKG